MTTPQALPQPEVSAASLRRLPAVVIGALVAAAVVIAGLIVLANRPAWWGGFLPATVVAALSAIGSIAILRLAPGKALEKVVTIVYGAAAVRLLIALFGCLIALKVGQYPPKPTGLMVVGYYVAMLVAESVVLAKAVSSATMKKETEEGK